MQQRLRSPASDAGLGQHCSWRAAAASCCCRHPPASRCRPAAAAAAQEPSQAHGQHEQPSYPYNSGDGRRQKATIEHVFFPDGSGADGGADGGARSIQAPWSVGWQMNERNIMWNDDLKMRLIKRVASQELSISEEELEERLQGLYNLLPDLASRLVKAPPQRVAQLAANTDLVAARLLQLREIFPKANTSALVSSRLSLLLDEDLGEVAAAAARLRELLPQLLVDRLVEAFPAVIDVDDFELALQDAKRLMPHIDVAQTLRSNPELILSLQKGKNLIPYDEVPPTSPRGSKP